MLSPPSAPGDLVSVSRELREAVAATSESLAPVGFWASVCLPFVHVPLLVTGLDGDTRTALFLCLLAANAVALYLGRDYAR